MTRQRINLRIDRVIISGGRFSERTLAGAIEVELGMRLQRYHVTDLVPQARAVPMIDGGRANGSHRGQGLEAGVGQAVARATMGVLKPSGGNS